MIERPADTKAQASAPSQAAPQGQAAPTPLGQAVGKGRALVANVAEFLTRRRQSRSGLYLPLVRIDSRD